MMNLGESNKRAFPRSTVSNVKPGRHEFLRNLGIVDNAMMTDADVNRILQIVAPGEAFVLDDTITTENIINRLAARDNPGVFSEFGSIYLRSTTDPGLSGSSAEGMPGYEDYSSVTTQTAVEWFAFQIMDSWNDIQNGKTSIDELIEQAKQMEKEQIMDAHIEGQRVFDKHPHTHWTNDQAEQYYNEMYK